MLEDQTQVVTEIPNATVRYVLTSLKYVLQFY